MSGILTRPTGLIKPNLSATFAAQMAATGWDAWWRLGEPSGTSAADATGNSHTGTYVNSPTLAVAGLIAGDADTAVTFDGSNDRVDVPDSAAWDASVLTVAAVIKTSQATTGEILTRDTSTASRGFQFRVNSGKLELLIINSVGTAVGSASTATVNDGVKHHVAATYDGSNIRLYVGGTPDTVTACTLVIPNTAIGLTIGARLSSGSTYGNFYNGTLDEPAFKGAVLSGAAIAALAALI